jgi:hypothetical protein
MFDLGPITYRCADHPVLPGLESYTRTRRHVRVANTELDLLELTATSGRARGEVSFTGEQPRRALWIGREPAWRLHANCRMPDRTLPQAQAWPDTMAGRAVRRAHERT